MPERTGSRTTTTSDDDHYWYLYDANGNVGQILDASDRSTVASYEYDPYGNVLIATGTKASDNPFRFSTKWLDDELAVSGQTGAIGETGLYYYGYRYYAPNLGRWISRDPIEEAGGTNLFAYVENHPLDATDQLGLSAFNIDPNNECNLCLINVEKPCQCSDVCPGIYNCWGDCPCNWVEKDRYCVWLTLTTALGLFSDVYYVWQVDYVLEECVNSTGGLVKTRDGTDSTFLGKFKLYGTSFLMLGRIPCGTIVPSPKPPSLPSPPMA